MPEYVLLKVVHVLSSTILFGAGIGTAFHMWATHLRGNVQAIASTARNVVLADWLFTATSGVVQPATGLALVWVAGYGFFEPWLVVSYVLYAVAGGCWIAVVAIQLRVAKLAVRAAESGAALPPDYYRLMRLWFALGWPAFVGLVAVFWLMVAQPQLW